MILKSGFWLVSPQMQFIKADLILQIHLEIFTTRLVGQRELLSIPVQPVFFNQPMAAMGYMYLRVFHLLLFL